MYRIVYLFFFFSGFTSLVFEVIWERELMQVFGTTSFALSTLLTAFMAGLALGSVLGGRVAARLRRPLRVYGLLEGGIGLYALAVPLLLDGLPWVYGLIFDRFLQDFYLFSLLRFVAVFLVLVLPTTLMGATLPIVSQWVAERARLFQGKIGLLYGVNTLGACAGAGLAGFVILPGLGLEAANTLFACSNFVLCAVVLLSERVLQARATRLDEQQEEIDEEATALLEATRGVRAQAEAVPGWLVRGALVAFAAAGAISMTYQVLFTRAYVIILGSSTYSFTIILVSFLVGLSLGSAVMSAALPRIRRPLVWLAATQLGVALLATLAFFVLDGLPGWLFERLRGEIGSAADVYAYNFFLVGVVVLLPTALQGMSFPLVVRAVVRRTEGSGQQVGGVYAFNTGGAIVGSFAAGFVLMPWLGLHTAIVAAVCSNLAVGLALAVATMTSGFEPRRAGALALAALLAVGALVVAPEIDRVKLTRGMFRVYWARELFDPEKFARDQPELVYYADGLTATTSVEQRGKLVTLKANGKPEASDGADMSTQILVGLLPFVFRSGDPTLPVGRERAVMVGYGSGVTAGASLQWPLERLEVVEIERTMVGASRFFNHVNHRPLDDERMHLVISDGRNYLEYSDRRWDVIVSEPSNPWIAGVASLFTVEHFRRARRHLAPGGVFGQWVQLYELRPKNVKRIFATFLEVFPHVLALSSKAKGTDLILLGSDRPLLLPEEGFERAWQIPEVRAELRRAGIEGPEEIYGLTFMTRQELKAFARGAELNTDDNGLLEFEAPKDLVRYDVGRDFFSDHYHDRPIYGDPRPLLPPFSRLPSDLVARHARAQWLGGKPALGDAMLRDAGLDPEQPPSPDDPPGPVRDYLSVRAAQRAELGPALVHTWPFNRSELHFVLADTVRGGKETQATVYLESTERPHPRRGYAGERGLLYAYLLWARRYYRHAQWQLERLEEDADPLIVDSLAFHLLVGQVEARRLHYRRAWEALKRAGEMGFVEAS